METDKRGNRTFHHQGGKIMEAIRQYIESLFMNLPNTGEVFTAKGRLLEMAEDKYNSLKEDGLSDNEAVAKVISEFGNLDELKEELGITEQVNWKTENRNQVKLIDQADTDNYLRDCSKAGLIRGIGIFCFVCCIVPPILFDSNGSAALMFIMIAIGVVCMVLQKSFLSNWSFFNDSPVGLDISTASYVKEERKRRTTGLLTIRTIGLLLIVLCFTPAIIYDGDEVAALLFIMIGSGLICLTYAAGMEKAYNRLLGLNPMNTVGGYYSKGSGRIVYNNKELAAIMSIYWPLATCIYLAISFLTFMWWITWIVFPVAAIINKYIEERFGERE